MPTAASGRVRSCDHTLYDQSRSLGEKGSRDVHRAEIVEIIMTAFGKSYHLLRLTSKLIEPLAEADRNRAIPLAMHDQDRRGHIGDPLVGMKLIAYEPAHRDERKCRRGDIR